MMNGTPRSSEPRRVVAEMYEVAALRMLRKPDLLPRIAGDIEALGVVGERSLAFIIYLIGTSRLAERPLAGIVQGSSASGKSYIIESVARLFPPEAVLHAHRITPQALYHLPAGALARRFVVAGERARAQNDATAEATRALREMLSSGRLTKLITTRTQGGFITETIDQTGPIAHVESTTVKQVFEEDCNRALLLRTDDTPAQTRRINVAAARRKAGAADAGDEPSAHDVIARHHALQRILESRRVIIPFAMSLAEGFPDERVESRRAFPLLLGLIEAVALLHQFQRATDPDAGDPIEAVPEDYAAARSLMADAGIDMQPPGVSQAAARLYERLRTYPLPEEFTTDDIAKHEAVISDVQTIRKYARELADAGCLVRVRDRRGSQPAAYRLADPTTTAARLAGLPAVDPSQFDRG